MTNATMGSTTLPNQMIGNWLTNLTGDELKVVMFLALQTSGFSSALNDMNLRQIALATNLSKKEVRNALRLLTVHEMFADRFAVSAFPEASKLGLA